MTYDEDFAHRVRDQLANEDAITEKAMFGGLAFLLHGNMAVGISSGGELMVRVGPEATDEALGRPHTRLFDLTGRPMKGWILVAPEGVKTKRGLGTWVARGVDSAGTLPQGEPACRSTCARRSRSRGRVPRSPLSQAIRTTPRRGTRTSGPSSGSRRGRSRLARGSSSLRSSSGGGWPAPTRSPSWWRGSGS